MLQGNLRVPGGSSEGVPDDEEDSSDHRWEKKERYDELPQRPVHRFQSTTNISLLLSAFATGLRIGTPHTSTFSGDAIPGKTKVSFEQWYHEVQCAMDHYPEAVVWHNIIHSLKGASTDMAQYMRPIVSVDHILQKLSVIFCLVALLFDVLMQNVYKESE